MYLVRGITKFLLQKGRSVKNNNRDLMETINNKTGINQYQITRRFKVYQATISLTLRKRRKASKNR